MFQRIFICFLFSIHLAAAHDNSPHFMGVGSAVIDFLAQVSDDFVEEHIPGRKGGSVHCEPEKFDQVLDLLGPTLKTALGGSAGNTVRTMARLGVSSTFISQVGEDSDGDRYIEEMRERGILGIMQDPDFTTIRILCLVTPDGERTFLHAHDDIGWSFNPAPELFCNARWVHFESFLLWEDPNFIEQSLRFAHEAGVTVSLDLANFLVVQQYREKLLEWIEKYVDVVFGNKEEIRYLTGMSPEAGCLLIQDLCPIVVITKGNEGCLVGSQGALTQVPALPAKVVDTTAAGDYFTAGFIYGYLHQKSLHNCARIGNRLGCAIIEYIGTELPMEKWKEIHCFLQLEN